MIVLGADELEAIRLADVEGLYQEGAAARMGVSRATFGRILAAARSKVARALVEGTVLLIGGGDDARDPSREDTTCPRRGPAGGPGRRCTCGVRGRMETSGGKREV